MPAERILDLDDVCYTAGGRSILQDINWSVEAGVHWAVVGPNGSGKTTLLRVACGFAWPTGGVIRRLGQTLTDLGTLRRSIGWISSDLVGRIPPREIARDTVVAGRFAQVGFKDLPSLRPTAADYAQADQVLDQLGCADLQNRPFGVLSQGEKQKVLIARARLADPLLLVLDEPCAGMDPGARESFLATLEDLARERQLPTIILVTHHVEEIMPSITQTLVLANGRAVAAGSTSDAITPKSLTDVYGVAIDRLETAGGRCWPIWASS